MKQKKQILLFLIKIFLFTLQLVFFQAAIFLIFKGESIGEEIKDTEETTELKAAVANDLDILYLGDSTLTFTGGKDSDQRKIHEILADLMPEREITTITHPAFHVGVYNDILNYVIQQNQKPLLIFPITLRQFVNSWNYRPEYQFLDVKKALERDRNVWDKMNSLLYSNLDVDDTITQEDYLKLPVYKQEEILGTIEEFEQIKMNTTKNQNILKYMQTISTDSRKYKELEQILSMCNEHQVPTIIYFTPINYIVGNKTVGQDFSKLIDINKKIVSSLAKNYDIDIIDLSYALGTNGFVTDQPDEHLTFIGRELIARTIATEIKQSAQNE